MGDEERLRALCGEDEAAVAALDRILGRLAAEERVCELVRVNLSPRLRKESVKKIYWWDVTTALKEWEARL